MADHENLTMQKKKLSPEWNEKESIIYAQYKTPLL